MCGYILKPRILDMGAHVQIAHFNFTDHWDYSPTPSQQTAIHTEMIQIYALYVKDGKHVGLLAYRELFCQLH